MKKKSNFSVKRTIQILFVGIMLVSLTLTSTYSVALVREMSDRSAREARAAISTYMQDFEKRQQIVENYLANLVLSNIYFKQMAAATTENEMYLYSYSLQDSLDTLLAVSGGGYSVVLYHAGCDYMVSVQHDLSTNDESRLMYEWKLKQALHTYLTGDEINRTDWFCLPMEDEMLYCRIVQYKNVSCCCVYALSDLVENFEASKEDTVVLMAGDGQPLFDAQVPIDIAELHFPANTDHADYVGFLSRYLVSQAVSGDLTLIRFSPYGIGAADSIIQVVLSLFLLISVFAICLVYLWRTVYQPMQHLTATMRKLNDGQAEPEILDKVYAGEEFRQVNVTVKNLLSQITTLKIESYEKELARRDAQLQYLRAQIRPHFFLNCLKNLYAMAQFSTADELQETILLLSKHMRYILSDHDHYTPLKNELDLCENYVELFASMNTSFDPEFRADIEPALLDQQIPPVSVLTLVENAVKYSLREDRPLRILVSANILTVEGDQKLVNLSVRDNGLGMAEDILYRLNHLDLAEKNDPHVGIRNLIRRFTVLYGSDFQIGFFNGTPQDQFCGARIELFFPMKKKDECQ